MLTAQRASLRQLDWILAAAIIAPAVVFAFTAWFGYQTAKNLTDRQVLRARDVAHEHAIKVFETIDRTVVLMEEIASRTPSVDEERLHERLKSIVAGLPQIKSAWVFDGKGHSIANSIVSPSPKSIFPTATTFARMSSRITACSSVRSWSRARPRAASDFSASAGAAARLTEASPASSRFRRSPNISNPSTPGSAARRDPTTRSCARTARYSPGIHARPSRSRSPPVGSLPA